MDILVNHAARRPRKPFLETTDGDWLGALDVALTGTYRASRAFLPAWWTVAGVGSSISPA